MTPKSWRKSSRSQNNGNCVEVGCVHTAPNWRKSSRSASNGDCVEVGCVHTASNWRKGSRSANNGGNCLEVAHAVTVVAMRDSKLPTGDYPTLAVSRGEWLSLLTAVRDGALTR